MIDYGEVALRARESGDVAVLHRELYDDVVTRTRADGRAWRPLTLEQSPYRVDAGDEQVEAFTVIERATGAIAGEAALWQVDLHNRAANVGIALVPAFRGRGLAMPTLGALCSYAFDLRGLHRLQLETTADNEPMQRAAARVGFDGEGRRRESQWVAGRFVDVVVFGMVEEDWRAGARDATVRG